jgi:hypothetical protein
MFALPPFRVIVPRSTFAARAGAHTPAYVTAKPAPAAVVPPRPPRAVSAGTTSLGPSDADPAGLRVVPLRPDSVWPVGRAYDRVASPFRAFPYRSLHLTRLMSPVDPRD